MAVHMVEQIIKYSDGTETKISYRGEIVNGVLIPDGENMEEEAKEEVAAEEVAEEVSTESVEDAGEVLEEASEEVAE